MAFAAEALTITGETRQFRARSFRGTDAVRNACPVCSGLVFGGPLGETDSHNIYAGSLDDPALFHPTLAVFASRRAPWALIPEGLRVFDTLPGAAAG